MAAFNLPESKISVVYESCHSEFQSTSKKEFLNLSNFVCFGSDDPRKNTEFVLSTFDVFISKNKNYYLDVVGLPDYYIKYLISKLGLKNESNFIFHSHISRDQLVLIYENSVALIYPSLYEGFGVPIIEAFKTNTPVVTSSFSSLPEIAGEAGIFIDPYSKSDLLKALNFITVEDNFELFSLKAKLRSNDFNWKLFSKQTLAIYYEEI
jgi:glycosyltransferase involved in cell wall biosynthesis